MPDAWKEELLLSLEKDAISVIKFADYNQYKIWGFYFFNHKERIREFADDMERII